MVVSGLRSSLTMLGSDESKNESVNVGRVGKSFGVKFSSEGILWTTTGVVEVSENVDERRRASVVRKSSACGRLHFLAFNLDFIAIPVRRRTRVA